MGKFGMTYLVAVTIAIETEMKAFYGENSYVAEYERVIPKMLKQGMGMAYEAWNPILTKGIPTALCLN